MLVARRSELFLLLGVAPQPLPPALLVVLHRVDNPGDTRQRQRDLHEVSDPALLDHRHRQEPDRSGRSRDRHGLPRLAAGIGVAPRLVGVVRELMSGPTLYAPAAVRGRAPRLLLLGGGGYNPWTVGRLWTLLWADLSGQAVPDTLPHEAAAVLRGLSWQGGGRAVPGQDLLTRLQDPPRTGPVRAEVSDRLARLAAR